MGLPVGPNIEMGVPIWDWERTGIPNAIMVVPCRSQRHIGTPKVSLGTKRESQMVPNKYAGIQPRSQSRSGSPARKMGVPNARWESRTQDGSPDRKMGLPVRSQPARGSPSSFPSSSWESHVVTQQDLGSQVVPKADAGVPCRSQ